MEEIFGEVISAYSRQQAIEDGVLVEIGPKLQAEIGFRYHTVITQAVHTLCTPPKSNRIESYEGRLWDVLWMAKAAMKRTQSGDQAPFTVRIGRRNYRLIAHVGPGDNAEPVITIGLPEDM